MIIGLCGPKCSGKGTIATYLVDHYRARTFSMSGILRDILDRLTLSASRENMIQLALRLREQFGSDILAQAVKNHIEKERPDCGIIDGVRYAAEWEIFSQLSDFQLWYIDAPLELRFARQQQRGEKVGERDQSFDNFIKEEQAQTEQGIAGLRQHAAHIMTNDSTVSVLYAKIDDMMRAGLQ